MQTSLNIVDEFDIPRIPLEANLDVGGYAWLRRGAFPDDKDEFISIFNRYVTGGDPSSLTASNNLANELFQIVMDNDEAYVRQFVLSPEFQKFRPLFLGEEMGRQF